jgi:hypothetical protein
MANDTPTDPNFRLPSTEGVIAKAGTVPPLRIDLNHDGIDDLQQLREGLLRAQPILETVLRIVLLFAAPQTKVGQWVGAYFTQGKPALEAVVQELK